VAQATTIKGGKVIVYLESRVSPGVYESPCGFTQRSFTLTKELNEFQIPDCDDPDAIDWVGRDAASLSMSVSGEGVAAYESFEDWLDAFHDTDPINVRIDIIFPAKTIRYTGAMHIANVEMAAPNGQRVTMNVEMQSDGQMVKTDTHP
jgi:predicted secreted protein